MPSMTANGAPRPAAQPSPAPWVLEGDLILDARRHPVGEPLGTTAAQAVANGLMQAAAPELIDALQKLADRTLQYVGGGKIDEFLDCDREMQELARAGLDLIRRVRRG